MCNSKIAHIDKKIKLFLAFKATSLSFGVKLPLYDFLLAGDLVDQPVYTPEGLQEANHSMDKLDIALMIAESIAEL